MLRVEMDFLQERRNGFIYSTNTFNHRLVVNVVGIFVAEGVDVYSDVLLGPYTCFSVVAIVEAVVKVERVMAAVACKKK